MHLSYNTWTKDFFVEQGSIHDAQQLSIGISKIYDLLLMYHKFAQYNNLLHS